MSSDPSIQDVVEAVLGKSKYSHIEPDLVARLDRGDVVIDGGNSYFPDTMRRVTEVEKKGLWYVGTGVSGGEDGALMGPSIMPGGSSAAWPHVKEIFQAISAKVDGGIPTLQLPHFRPLILLKKELILLWVQFYFKFKILS